MRLIDADALCEECVGSIIKCVGIGCRVPKWRNFVGKTQTLIV